MEVVALRMPALMVAVAIVAVLAAATPALAGPCPNTPCGLSWQQFNAASPWIALARYEGVHDGRAQFAVIDVLKGRPHRWASSKDDAWLFGFFGRHQRIGSRWLLAGEPHELIWTFKVRPDGTVENSEEGEGFFDDYPYTLAGWYRALGGSPPDTATIPQQPTRGNETPIAFLVAASIAGFALALRRRRPGGLASSPRTGVLTRIAQRLPARLDE